MVSKAAKRYAKAFLQYAIDEKAVSDVHTDILKIHETFDSSEELVRFFKNPVIKKSDKAEVFKKLFKSELSGQIHDFIDLIFDNDREQLLHEITKAFIDLYKEFAGIIDVSVFSASSLTKDQIQKLNKTLESATGKTVNLHFSEDPDLMGGITVRIDDTVIDGSIKYKINQLKNLFMDPAV